MKVLIVDDEFYFRKALTETIDWESLGLEVCGGAEDGAEGLQMIEREHPDIVLADINMPKMDGLVFARKVKEYDRGIKIIFISGYDDFSYVRQALNLEADDYLLKPVKESELLVTLRRVLEKSRKEKVFYEQMEELQTGQQRDRELKKQYYLTQALLTESEEDQKNFLNKFRELAMAQQKGFFIAVGESGSEIELKEEDYFLWNFTGANYLGERLENRYLTVLQEVENRVVFFVQISDGKERDEIMRELREGQKTLEEYFRFQMVWGISKNHWNLEEIKMAYREALQALDDRCCEFIEGIVEFDDEEPINRYAISSRDRVQIKSCLRAGDREGLVQALEEVFAQAKLRRITLGRFRVLCIELLALCIDIKTDATALYGQMANQEQINMFDEIRRKRNFKGLQSYVIQFYKELCTVKEKREQLPDNVRRVLEIIEERYGDEGLNVDSIAKEIFVNYNYLCVVFKKALHITINDYLFKFRMQKAIECFNNGCSQVQEAAEKTGYTNVGYFTRCFRKEFGMTPSAYINSLE